MMNKTLKYRRRQKRFATKFFSGYRAICSLTLILLISLVMLQAKAEGKNEIQYRTIVIESGDTLWKISQKYKNKNEDIRDFISIIKKINNIDSTIYPGDTILIPLR